jgi:hypothetical protein
MYHMLGPLDLESWARQFDPKVRRSAISTESIYSLTVILSPRGRRFLYLVLAPTLSSCYSTINETFYEYRIPSAIEFDQPGNYSCDRETVLSETVFDLGKRVRIQIGNTKIPEVHLVFRPGSRRVDAHLVSEEFAIVSDDEEFDPSIESATYLVRSVTYELQVPRRFRQFALLVPDVEIDGVRQPVPPIEFRTVTGERKVARCVTPGLYF